ncbi:MAG: DUF1176 domain-containing protein [Mesorhizobium sp.]
MSFILAPVAEAAGQEPPYLDDRSTPQAVVKSLYNAVSRKEFGRAWGYFATPPAADFESFEKGYADTQDVDVLVGRPIMEGAAGSTIYTLPVAIRSHGPTDEKVFSGCYTLRLANPQIQGNPFHPLGIEKGDLKPSDAPLEQSLPTACEGVELGAQNWMVEKARAMFVGGRGQECPLAELENETPEVDTFEYHLKSDGESEPAKTATLVRFICDRGAYNERSTFYLGRSDDLSVKPVKFAMPELDIRYEGDGDTKLESVNIIGFNAVSDLVNAQYDAVTHTLVSQSMWRGLGDASSIGRWIFRDGDFALVKFDVDPTYDEKVEHITVLDYDTGP